MITILHGDNQVASRDRLAKIKSQAKTDDKEIISLDGSSVDLTDLVQSLETTSLFNNDRLVVVENLISNLRIGKKRDEIINYLLKAPWAISDSDPRFCGNNNLVLWEKKSVGRQIIKLKRQKHVSVEEFKMPTVIFKFVDSILPNNQKQLLSTFHETLANNVVPEIVFVMIVRQFRIMLSIQTSAYISEAKRLAPWQKGRLTKQSQSFSLDKLKKHYKDLLIIDYQLKTGRSPFDLTKKIEQFIIGL